jgi:D-alanyl-D-alanine carboxypeptidase/D-alanyl-D-alanine-endopeptidase (penicillin-binding protein 4)
MHAAVPLNKKYLRSLIFCLLCLHAFPLKAEDSNIKSEVDRVLAGADKQIEISIQVLDLKTGKEIYSKNAGLPLKPASTMKILTTVTAFQELGTDYYYQTPFLISYDQNKSAPSLYIKGVGDPFMTTEFLWLAARKIKVLGIKSINQIIIDDTDFLDPPERKGQNSYMAGPSALAFNFNSISINVCPNPTGGKPVVTADPWEASMEIISSVTAVTKDESVISVDEIEGGKSDFSKFRVSGKLNVADGCQLVNRSVSRPTYYFAGTLEGYLKYMGIKVNKKFALGEYPESKGRTFVQTSYPLSYIIEGLNHYSTNFIAEQILYTLGSDPQSKNYDRLIGIGKIEALLQKLGIDKAQYSIYDGSGLSYENRLSADILAKFLMYAYRQINYKNEFLVSLPIAGVSGTLRKRDFDTSKAMIRAKTGSLDGVNSLAGYIFTNKQKQYAFAIIQNQVKSRDSGLKLEEKIVDVIAGT